MQIWLQFVSFDRISFCDPLYEVISKFLTLRVYKILIMLIVPMQYVFVEEPATLDNVMSIRDLVKQYSGTMTPSSVLRLKTYTHISLSTLDQESSCFGGCIVINGSLKGNSK